MVVAGTSYLSETEAHLWEAWADSPPGRKGSQLKYEKPRAATRGFFRVFHELVCAAVRMGCRKGFMAKKNKAAVQLGRRGGKATAKKRTLEQRQEAARKAAEARWARKS